MSDKVIYDEVVGKIEKDGEQWEARWQFNDGKPVNVTINFDDDPDAMPEPLRRFFVTLKNNDGQVRSQIAEQLIDLCNEDWNPGANITQEDFAKRISLDGVNLYYPGDNAEIFYNDDDIFAGHSIATLIDLNGKIAEPYLAG